MNMHETSTSEEKIVVIFSGYNNRGVISFIRTLEKNSIEYVVIAKNNQDPIFKTVYKDKVILTRKSLDLNLGAITKYIQIIQNKFEVKHCFIAPSTEALNRFMQKERVALEMMHVIIPLVDAKVYESVSDKKVFTEICLNNGILVPDEYSSIETAKFPFVAKPRKYFSQDGSIFTPFLIFDNEQKNSFLRECSPVDFYIQEFVEGKSIYLLYYFHRNGSCYKYSQENLMQEPDGGSMVAAIPSDFHNTDESTKYEKLFKELGFYGLVMVELKVNDDSCYMIEANPRFWGPSQLFVDSDSNFFEAFLYDYGFTNSKPIFVDANDAKYFWSGGVHSASRKNRSLTFHAGCVEDLHKNMNDWTQHDVYNRADTIEIFREGI